MPHTAPVSPPCGLENTAAGGSQVGGQTGLASMWLQLARLKKA